jgi:phage/plasmid-like protein (TIGR03299 family)
MEGYEMPAAVETMFSAREVPWHGLGVVTDQCLTAADAIVTAGLDWTVSSEPLFAEIAGEKILVPGKKAQVRSSDHKVLGIVTPKFKNLQNHEAFTFADNLVDDGRAHYETAGALRGGRVVFMTMKVPVEMNVAGSDEHDLYLILRMGHDGTMAINAELSPIRVVCLNTMKLATASAVSRWSIRHTGSIEGRLEEARIALQLSFTYAEEFVKLGNSMVATRITDDMLVQLLEETLPNRPKTPEKIEDIMSLYRESNTNGFTGTAWGAINAFTEYYDHGRDTRSQEAVFTTIMDGEVASMRQRLTDRLLSV